MRSVVRRIRGAIGMGLTWGLAGACAGFVAAAMTGFKADAPFPLVFGVFGFLGGLVFSAILTIAEGRRGFDPMSLPRFAGWGALGGVILAVAFTRAVSFAWSDLLVIAPTFAVASAACAAGSLAVARRSEPEAAGPWWVRRRSASLAAVRPSAAC